MTEQEICTLYSDPTRSLESVAKQAKTSVYLVRRCLDKNGIEIRPSGRPRVGITDPKALVHLGVKISKADRDALETGAGKSANVREAIKLWKNFGKDEQIIALWIGALRYYMGRQTYAVSEFCEMLKNGWELFPKDLKVLIKRDLDESFVKDDQARFERSSYRPLGADCNRAEWEKVRRLWEKNGNN